MNKRYRFIISALSMLFFATSVFAENNEKPAQATPITSDSIMTDPDIIRTLPIGRFDRGIVSYRFIPKGNKIYGITASFSNYDSSDSQFLSLLQGLSYSGKTVKVNPFMGYFFKDNACIGLKLGYTNTLATLDNLDLAIEDLDFSIGNMRLSETMLNGTIFHRSYVGLGKSRRFGLFNETNLSVSVGESSFSRLKEGEPYLTDTKNLEVQLGISPGVSVFIMQNVAAEFSFGIAGLTYRHATQQINGESAGSRTVGGANFKINITNINIGVTVCL